MLTKSELQAVFERAKSYPHVFRWGWADGPLSIKQVAKTPGFGWPAVRLAEFRYQLTESGIVQALKDIYDYYYAMTGESYIKSYTRKANSFNERLYEEFLAR